MPCAWCGKSFAPRAWAPGGRKDHCSARCWNAARYRRERPADTLSRDVVVVGATWRKVMYLDATPRVVVITLAAIKWDRRYPRPITVTVRL